MLSIFWLNNIRFFVSYSMDIGSDVSLGTKFLHDNDTVWGVATLTFVIVPAIIVAVSSIYAFWRQRRLSTALKNFGYVSSCFLLGPLVFRFLFIRESFGKYGCSRFCGGDLKEDDNFSKSQELKKV